MPSDVGRYRHPGSLSAGVPGVRACRQSLEGPQWLCPFQTNTLLIPQAQSGLAAVAPAASQAAQAAANHLAYPQSLVQMNGSLLASAQSQPQQFQHYAQLLQHQQLLQQLQVRLSCSCDVMSASAQDLV